MGLFVGKLALLACVNVWQVHFLMLDAFPCYSVLAFLIRNSRAEPFSAPCRAHITA